jgi:hypothetical protein
MVIPVMMTMMMMPFPLYGACIHRQHLGNDAFIFATALTNFLVLMYEWIILFLFLNMPMTRRQYDYHHQQQ